VHSFVLIYFRWFETFGKGAPRRQGSEILTRFRKFLPPPPPSTSTSSSSSPEVVPTPEMAASTLGAAPSSSSAEAAAADATTTTGTSTHVEGSKAEDKRDANLCPPTNGLANESLNGWRWRHPLRAPLPFHVSAGGQYPLGREALQASLVNKAAYNDARLQKFFRKV